MNGATGDRRSSTGHLSKGKTLTSPPAVRFSSSAKMRRRQFLLASAGFLTTGSFSCRLNRRTLELPFPGEILGASADIGHLLIQHQLPAPRTVRKASVVIVGSGIAGLSAGWKFHNSGFQDFEILELEPEVGGNARAGENSVSGFPWGAHYVPVPTHESRAVRELFEELGVIEKYTPGGAPVYREEFLCFSPQERLYIHGRWQEGLLPMIGTTPRDLEQYDRFKDIILWYRNRRDRFGRKAFAIPMEYSAQDNDLLELDRISIREFLYNHGLDSVPLHWYVNYACRDDYGSTSADVSAWAGLHYFASRDAESGEMEASTVLTWPEGNGWIIRQLRQKLQPRITTNVLVYHLETGEAGISVDCYHPKERVSHRILAKDLIFAAPTFLLQYLTPPMRTLSPQAIHEFQYAPWLVANLTLNAFPQQRAGVPLAWDNVVYDSDTLGYVVATHQTLKTYLRQTVFTFYHAMAEGLPTSQRLRLFETSWRDWVKFIVKDLSRPHPEIQTLIERLDIFRWGHAMVRPRVGFVWGEASRQARQPHGNLYLAHSDLSGFSIFEEAQYRGILASERILQKYKIPFTSSL
jgi:hypothetical protein